MHAETQLEIARELAAHAEAAAERGDHRGAAGFYGAAAAAMAPFDEAEEYDYLCAKLEMLLRHAFPYGDVRVLRQALHLLLHRLLPMRPRSTHPRSWADLQSDLGMTYRYLGMAEDDPAILTQAIPHLRGALEVVRPELRPERWARLQYRLGGVFERLVEMGEGDLYIRDAIDAFGAARDAVDRDEEPALWAACLSGTCNLLVYIAEKYEDAESAKLALEGYEQALAALTHLEGESGLCHLEDRIAKARKLAGA